MVSLFQLVLDEDKFICAWVNTKNVSTEWADVFFLSFHFQLIHSKSICQKGNILF